MNYEDILKNSKPAVEGKQHLLQRNWDASRPLQLLSSLRWKKIDKLLHFVPIRERSNDRMEPRSDELGGEGDIP